MYVNVSNKLYKTSLINSSATEAGEKNFKMEIEIEIRGEGGRQQQLPQLRDIKIDYNWAGKYS